MKTKYQYKTSEEYRAYLEGYYDGVEAYAVWKDGKEVVGIEQHPISKIKDEVNEALETL